MDSANILKEDACSNCVHAKDTAIFELCMAPIATYKDNMGKMQQHTRTHIIRGARVCANHKRK